MKNKTSFLVFVGFSISLLTFSCGTNNNRTSVQDEYNQVKALRTTEGQELAKQGEYLVTVGGCNDCHSPKVFSAAGMEIDSSKLFSGHPENNNFPAPDPKATQPGNWVQMTPDATSFAGPWGVSYAANLTPDSATGIGAWSEEVFIKTLRTGKHLGQEGGRPILPPMPWFNLAKLKTEDLRAIYAYLHSLPPINNKVPAPKSPADLQAATTASLHMKTTQ